MMVGMPKAATSSAVIVESRLGICSPGTVSSQQADRAAAASSRACASSPCLSFSFA